MDAVPWQVLRLCIVHLSVLRHSIFCIVVSVSAQCSLQPGLGELIHKFVEGACVVLVLCTAPCHSGGGRESTVISFCQCWQKLHQEHFVYMLSETLVIL